MKMVEFTSKIGNNITIAVDKIQFFLRFDDNNTTIYFTGDPDGFKLQETYENVVKKIAEA